MKRLYWDTAAGTPVDKRVFEAMKPFLMDEFGNANSIHQEGVQANQAVEKARAKIAKILSAHPDEIIFTGSGTESDNLAILGVAEAVGVRSSTSNLPEVELRTSKLGQIITTASEHKAVLEPCQYLQKKGFKVTYLKVDKNGQINLKDLKESLTKDTFLVSVMLANNEIGAIQPIREIAKIIRRWRKDHNSRLPYLHTDACQAPRFLDLNVEKLGVDLLSFNGSKIYGPKGIGALYVRRGVMLAPIIMGGGQERGLRSGTLNVAGIVGLAEALAICEQEREKESARLIGLRDKLIIELRKIPNLAINGPDVENVRSRISGSLEKRFLIFSRLPNNINFSIKNFEGEQLVIELDAKGFAVSAGSACSSLHQTNNRVRISFDREVRADDLKKFTRALKLIMLKYEELIN